MKPEPVRVGIDLGGTKIEGITLGSDGRVLERVRRPTPSGDYDATLNTIREVVGALHEIEAASGRTRRAGVVDPRILDLDLLLYGDLRIEEPGLSLLRGEILEYAFVLKPLADLAGESRHPVLGETYRALWERFDGDRDGLWPVAPADGAI